VTQAQAIDLIKNVSIDHSAPQFWADLGCGKGMFSIALASLLPERSRILCIDKTSYHFPPNTQNNVILEFRKMDFTQDSISDSKLDGILMANSLHFTPDKAELIPRLSAFLKYDGCFLIIEYDTDQSSWWNPYPIPYPELQRLFRDAGFSSMRKIGYRPSSWGPKNMYVCEIRR